MTVSTLTRRTLLSLGCSAAAFPLVTPVALAAAPWDARLVVIILRGGMDGLGVVQPYGDPDLAALRSGPLETGPEAGAHDLDGFFSLLPSMGALMPLWQAGELAFAHAVSTPYRDKRSHFDGQDLLEAGTGWVPGAPIARDGWLNRMLQVVPGVAVETAYAIGREDLRLTAGVAPVSNWAPNTRLVMSSQAEDLLRLVSAEDALFSGAIDEAVRLAAAEQAAQAEAAEDGTKRGPAHQRMAEFAAARLLEDTRIAAFSLNGWDTHNNQNVSLSRATDHLAETILTLRQALGPVWGKTAVIAMTEFGRTARQNGTRGTDHGTGGAMVMAGGALRGGRVYGRWPGLSDADLYARRDLMPTQDVRAHAARVMQGLFGLDQSVLETAIFPDLDMSDTPRLIL